MSDRNALQVVDGQLIVTPRCLDKVWGFQRQLAVPLSSISDVEIEQNPHKVRRGLRAPGLDAYWKRSGTFHPNGERHYWNQSGNGSVLMIRISDGSPFDCVYLSVADPEGAREILVSAAKLAS